MYIFSPQKVKLGRKLLYPRMYIFSPQNPYAFRLGYGRLRL